MRLAGTQNLVWTAIAALPLLLALGQAADASFVMRLTDLNSGEEKILIDGALSGAVSDGGYTATDPDMAGTIDGSIVHVGDIGSFRFSVTTGVSDPVIGNPINKRLDMVSLVVSGGVGLLQIEMTDTDFVFPRAEGAMHLASSIGGTTDGIVKAQSYVDLANVEFGTAITPGEQGPFGSEYNAGGYDKSFSGFDKVNFTLDAGQLFSLTQRVTVEHFGGSDPTTSFDIMTEVHTPEPATIMVWGLGIACVGFSSWRRRRR